MLAFVNQAIPSTKIFLQGDISLDVVKKKKSKKTSTLNRECLNQTSHIPVFLLLVEHLLKSCFLNTSQSRFGDRAQIS